MSRPTTKRVNGRWYDINSAAERIAELTDENAMLSRVSSIKHKAIIELDAKVAELKNQLASGVHTCSNQCQRPMCVLRREKLELEAQLEELQGKVDRYEKALTPSLETKRAYWGSDSTRCLPWADIKALMVLIRCHYAALQGKGDGE